MANIIYLYFRIYVRILLLFKNCTEYWVWLCIFTGFTGFFIFFFFISKSFLIFIKINFFVLIYCHQNFLKFNSINFLKFHINCKSIPCRKLIFLIYIFLIINIFLPRTASCKKTLTFLTKRLNIVPITNLIFLKTF